MTEKPMTESRLAEIRKRVEMAYQPQMFGWQARLDAAILDSMALLAEVERLQAREAALVQVVRAVADGWNNALGMRIGETPMDGVELKRKARALLASDSDEAK